ncbi:MAG: hypothetical protein ABI400_00875 [Lacisediminihabitans sp.]
MRFILAIVSFVLAFFLIGFGVAQRTIFAGPDHVTASVSLTSKAPVTIIDGATLNARPGHQTLDISGAKNIFAAYGRTGDVRAWVGDASYNKITYNRTTSALTSKLVKGKESKVPDPRGSDLWLEEHSSEVGLSFTANVPKGISVIIASDGAKAAPSSVAIRWPLDNRTPWSGPLVIAGVLLLLVGLGLYLWALYHLRKSRGPRRKSPKMPKLPKQRSYKPRRTKPPEITSGRRSSRKRRMIAVLPVLVAGTLALSGCSAGSAPAFLGGGSKPTPSATVAPDVTNNQQAPAVTVPQLKEIVANVSKIAAKADETTDETLLATRFAGAALQLRTANYEIRKKDSTVAALAAIPSGEVEVALPQQSNSWPRTVFTVLGHPKDKTFAPVALMLQQETPRDNYKVTYAMGLEAKVVLPKMASAQIGAPQLLPDNKFYLLSPGKVGAAYGDILLKGPSSEYAKYFDTSNDRFAKVQGFDAKQTRKASIPDKATIEFSNEPGLAEPIAFGTNNSGAIVAVNINQIETVAPSEAGASVGSTGLVKTLSGVSTTLKGLVSTYGDQLLFYVPKADSNQKIVLLGDADGIISAKEKS